jgi:hypothetical protein
MGRFIPMTVAALALGTALPAAAANRCQDEIRRWESTVSSYPSRGAERDANDELARAKDELRRGDDGRCMDHMARAWRIQRDDRASSRDDRRTEGSGGGIGGILRDLGR